MWEKALVTANFFGEHPLLIFAMCFLSFIFRDIIVKHLPSLVTQMFQVIARKRKLEDITIRAATFPVISGAPFRGSYIFPKIIMASSRRAYIAGLFAVTSFYREAGSPLTFSLIDTRIIQEAAMSALKDAFMAVMRHNNIELTVVFPIGGGEKDVIALKQWLEIEIEKKDSRSVRIRDDARAQLGCPVLSHQESVEPKYEA